MAHNRGQRGDDGISAKKRTNPRFENRSGIGLPTEVTSLLRDSSKGYECPGWEPTLTFLEQVYGMVWNNLAEAQRNQSCRLEGFRVTPKVESASS